MQNNETPRRTRKVPTNKRNELRIDEILSERGMLYKDLAALMGKDYSQIYKMLRTNPNLNTLVWVADVLGVRVRDLFVGSDDENHASIESNTEKPSEEHQPTLHAATVEIDGCYYKVCRCPKCGTIFEVDAKD